MKTYWRVLSTLTLAVFFAVTPSSAAIVDLTTSGACTPITAANIASCSINGAVFTQAFTQPTGSGVIDPFVREQDSGINTGMNTDAPANTVYDDVAGSFTHSIKVNQFGIVSLLGTDYVRFLLDINETSGGDNEFLVLDSLKIVTSLNTPNYTTIGAATADAGADIYDLNPPNAGSGPNAVLLNYALNSGSGSGDMFMYVPASLFVGTGNNYLYLYSQFGNVATTGQPPGYDASDGFEEWSKVNADGGGAGGGNPVPEPSQLLSLLLVGIPVMIGYWRKNRAGSGSLTN